MCPAHPDCCQFHPSRARSGAAQKSYRASRPVPSVLSACKTAKNQRQNQVGQYSEGPILDIESVLCFRAVPYLEVQYYWPRTFYRGEGVLYSEGHL